MPRQFPNINFLWVETDVLTASVRHWHSWRDSPYPFSIILRDALGLQAGQDQCYLFSFWFRLEEMKTDARWGCWRLNWRAMSRSVSGEVEVLWWGRWKNKNKKEVKNKEIYFGNDLFLIYVSRQYYSRLASARQFKSTHKKVGGPGVMLEKVVGVEIFRIKSP